MSEAVHSSTFRPARVARAACTLTLAAALLAVGANAVGLWVDLPGALAGYPALTQWAKVLDDHGPRVVHLLHAARLMGERDGVALAMREGIDVARYFLLPRPTYVVPDPPPTTPKPTPAYLARHRQFLADKQVRWLIWAERAPEPPAGPRKVRKPQEEMAAAAAVSTARLYDVRELLQGNLAGGVELTGVVAAERPTRAADYLAALLVVTGLVLLGWAVLPWLLGRGAGGAWLEVLPRQFALGTLVWYACLSCALLAGVGLTRARCLGGGLTLLAALALLRLIYWSRHRGARGAADPQNGAPARRLPPQSAIRNPQSAIGRSRFSVIRVLSVPLIGLSGLAVVASGLFMPVRNVDALHHWGFAAKLLYSEGGLRNSAYFDVDRGYDFRRYPLLTPLMMSTVHFALGRVEDQAVKVLFPTFFGMILLAVFGAMVRERAGPGAVLLLACLAGCGSYLGFGGGAVSALADVPLSLFLFLGLVEWRRWLVSGEGSHRAGWVLFFCGAAVTKTEGLAALAGALAMGAVLRRRVRPIPWRAVAAGAGLVAALVLPWYAFAGQLPGPSVYVARGGLAAVKKNLPALLPNVGRLLAEAGDTSHWGMLWMLLALAVLTGWRRCSAAHKVVLGLLALQVGAYLLSYLLTPHNSADLAGTTKMRFLLHLAPIGAYLTWVLLPRLPPWLERSGPQ